METQWHTYTLASYTASNNKTEKKKIKNLQKKICLAIKI